MPDIHAIIVGIEVYGGDFPATGACHDNFEMASWLTAQLVSPEQMIFFQSPLEENQKWQKLLESELKVPKANIRFADVATIMSYISDVLPGIYREMLVFYWAGHGIVDAHSNERRLLTADANFSGKSNIVVNSLLDFLASEKIVGFEKQLVLIDACANYYYASRDTGGLASHTFPTFQQGKGKQTVIFSASPGQVAQTNSEGSVFSRILFDSLKACESVESLDDELLFSQICSEFQKIGRTGSEVIQSPCSVRTQGFNVERVHSSLRDTNTGALLKVTTNAKPVNRRSKVKRIGVWDLDSNDELNLNKLLPEMNEVQTAFEFSQISGDIPQGAILNKQTLSTWLKRRGMKKIPVGLESHVLDDKLGPTGLRLLDEFDLDFIIFISKYKIASDGDDIDDLYDLYSSSFDDLIFVSTRRLRTLADEADIPLSCALAYLITAQILAEANTHLKFHDKQKGCLFDSDAGEDELIAGLSKPKICRDCTSRINQKYQDASQQLLKCCAPKKGIKVKALTPEDQKSTGASPKARKKR